MSDVTESDRTSHDIGVALFMLLWAGVGWASLLTNPDLFRDLYGGRDPGAGLMPVIVLSVLTAGGLALAVKPLAALVAGRGRLRVAFSPQWSTVAFFVCVAVFPAVMQVIGYVPTTLAFVFGWAMALSPDIRDRPIRAVVVAALAAAATTAVIHVGFDLIIGAQLP